ncbi:MAG TPA: hypothetical protein VM077_01965 [Candidatus Limnocylindrales bacterium]|nr:hypothetical protein [Candidatus Limnocylindrales bacterium]
MKEQYGFLIDLSGIQFNEDAPTWIQAFPVHCPPRLVQRLQLPPTHIVYLYEQLDI